MKSLPVVPDWTMFKTSARDRVVPSAKVNWPTLVKPNSPRMLSEASEFFSLMTTSLLKCDQITSLGLTSGANCTVLSPAPPVTSMVA